MGTLRKLQDWYSAQCDGKWEHGSGVKISTLDNPGWSIRVDLAGTSLEALNFERVTVEHSDQDWLSYWTEEKTFCGFGDPSKLQPLIEKFLEIAGT